jgi:PAS domain S-box-containing protein
MSPLDHYFATGIDRSQALPATYDPILVTLSYLIAALAGYAFLGLARHSSRLPDSVNRAFWLGGAAVTMGLGVWAMHFVGMLAYRLPIPVAYDAVVTAISALPPMVTSGVVLLVISRPVVSPWRLLLGGTCLGAGIGTMHYTGMAAMRMNAIMRFDLALYAVSILVAIVLAVLALSTTLWTVRHREADSSVSNVRHVAGALLMGLAVTGMHYTAMSSTLILPDPGANRVVGALDPSLFAALVVTVTALVLLMAIASMLFDQRLRSEVALRARAGELLRLREERLQLIMDNVADGLIAINTDGVVESFNRSAEQMFGYDASELTGRTAATLVFERDRPAYEASLRRYLAIGEAPFAGTGPVEVTGRHKNGSKVDLELVVTEAREGERTVFIGSVRNITERKSTQAQLQQAQKMEAVGQLTGGIAHDFNNMLGIIIGNLDLLNERVDGDARSAYLAGAALDSALRGSELVKRLLAFARRQCLSPERIDAKKALSGMVDILKTTLGEQITVRLELDEALWPTEADLAHFESAIVNLALNARDAMPDGGTFTIAASNRTVDEDYRAVYPDVAAGEYLCLSLSDTGIGMSPENQLHAFEPFFTTKPTGKGSGLGLSMVFGFIKQSNGHVTLYSEPGCGTTLRLYLPRSESLSPEHSEIRGHADAPAGSEVILVVEDNEAMGRVAVDQLESLGYSVVVSRNATEALEILSTPRRIDLMFSDIVMPGSFNGFELAREASALRPSLRVLLTSGFAQPAAQAPLGQRVDSMPALLTKPYRKHELAKAIRTALDE